MAQNDILLIDAPGENGPARDEAEFILDKKINDKFIEKVVKESTIINFHIINRLDNSNQEKLKELRSEANQSNIINKNYHTSVFHDIHNLKDIRLLKDAQNAIKTDIEDVFIDVQRNIHTAFNATY